MAPSGARGTMIIIKTYGKLGPGPVSNGTFQIMVRPEDDHGVCARMQMLIRGGVQGAAVDIGAIWDNQTGSPESTLRGGPGRPRGQACGRWPDEQIIHQQLAGEKGCPIPSCVWGERLSRVRAM